MCSLKFSKNIFPFAITFVLGLFLVGVFSYFASSSKVTTPQVNEVKVFSSNDKKASCNYDKKRSVYNVYNSTPKSEKRIAKPSFEETIIINEEVKQSRR